MARDDPTIYIRIPVELKQKLDEISAANRRSFTAEVVARLGASFQAREESVDRDMHLRAAALRARADMLDMRGELIKARIEGLMTRHQMLEAESRRAISEAKTAEDAERIQGIGAQTEALARDMAVLYEQAGALSTERELLNREYQELEVLLTERNSDLEQRLAKVRKELVT